MAITKERIDTALSCMETLKAHINKNPNTPLRDIIVEFSLNGHFSLALKRKGYITNTGTSKTPCYKWNRDTLDPRDARIVLEEIYVIDKEYRDGRKKVKTAIENMAAKQEEQDAFDVIQKISNRQLLAELKRRGYSGTLSKVETIEL